jgi:hypothetical protein
MEQKLVMAAFLRSRTRCLAVVVVVYFPVLMLFVPVQYTYKHALPTLCNTCLLHHLLVRKDLKLVCSGHHLSIATGLVSQILISQIEVIAYDNHTGVMHCLVTKMWHNNKHTPMLSAAFLGLREPSAEVIKKRVVWHEWKT